MITKSWMLHNVINQQPQPYGWSYKGSKGLALKNKTMGQCEHEPNASKGYGQTYMFIG